MSDCIEGRGGGGGENDNDIGFSRKLPPFFAENLSQLAIT
jgi:hypothetical protein